MQQSVIPTAEPFLFPGNKTGIVLVHGFTGAPKEMRWMGEYLAAQGYTVLGVRLAGHATQPADLVRTRWMDWLNSVEDGVHLLKSAGCQVFVMGLSLGGILTLLAAARFDLAGAVAMSTPYSLPPDPRLRYIKLLSWFVREIPKGKPDWRNPEAVKDHVDYPMYPTRSIVELRAIMAAMQAALPKITLPILLAHSHRDGGVPAENATRIFEQLGSTNKQLLWLENSGHVITREPERQYLFKEVHQFVQRVVGESG